MTTMTTNTIRTDAREWTISNTNDEFFAVSYTLVKKGKLWGTFYHFAKNADRKMFSATSMYEEMNISTVQAICEISDSDAEAKFRSEHKGFMTSVGYSTRELALKAINAHETEAARKAKNEEIKRQIKLGTRGRDFERLTKS